MPEPVPGTLYVVATPIGNLEDLTLRALRVLGSVSFIACEDTRTTSKLLARHGLATRLVSCHEHNERGRAGQIAEALARGEDVALVSDAGTPVVSDPGREVVAAARAAGARVVPLPGASAALAALSVSGIGAHRFTFFGFPPVKGQARAAFLDDVLGAEGAAIVFEAPHRIRRTLAELAHRAPERPASLHREITKLHEESRAGSLRELAEALRDAPSRGEHTLVVAGLDVDRESGGSLEQAISRALELVAAGRTARDAAREVARLAGVSRGRVYAALVGGRERPAAGRGEEE